MVLNHRKKSLSIDIHRDVHKGITGKILGIPSLNRTKDALVVVQRLADLLVERKTVAPRIDDAVFDGDADGFEHLRCLNTLRKVEVGGFQQGLPPSDNGCNAFCRVEFLEQLGEFLAAVAVLLQIAHQAVFRRLNVGGGHGKHQQKSIVVVSCDPRLPQNGGWQASNLGNLLTLVVFGEFLQCFSHLFRVRNTCAQSNSTVGQLEKIEFLRKIETAVAEVINRHHFFEEIAALHPTRLFHIDVHQRRATRRQRLRVVVVGTRNQRQNQTQIDKKKNVFFHINFY